MDNVERIRHRRERLGPIRWFFRGVGVALILCGMAAVLGGTIHLIRMGGWQWW